MIKITARHYVGLSNAHECNACHEKHLDLITVEHGASSTVTRSRFCLRCAAQLTLSMDGARREIDPLAQAGKELLDAQDGLANAALSMLEGEWNADARDELIEPARRWRDASERFLQLAHKER